VPIEGQSDRFLIRALMYGEARGEDPVGRLSVGMVAMNRAARPGHNLRGVILEPQQFSAFNPDDPNRGKLLDAWRSDPVAWARCDETAVLVEAALARDPTLGAQFYFNPEPTRPLWADPAKGFVQTFACGKHVFGRFAR
jgi:spore germination cell wall hydrolase CwlJ-like protein